MNWPEALLKETSKTYVQQLAAYAGSEAVRFEALMNCFFSTEYRLAQRASRVVDLVIEKHPELLIPYHDAFFKNLQRQDIGETLKRNSIRMLQTIAIPEAYHGLVLDCCVRVLNHPMEPPAIKAFSLTVFHRLVQWYPELGVELRTIIEDRMPYESPAFRSRAVKILRQLTP